jgi:hypothetical protein
MHIPEEILKVAKESALRFGRVEPMLFVDGTKSKVYLNLPFGETLDARVAIMTEVGITLAKSNRIGDVERVIFVSEAWASPSRAQYTWPSQDPDRMEVLLFNLLDAKTNTQVLEMYACIRNKRQDIIDLKLVPQPDGGTVGGTLLPSFLAGFKLFKR